MKEFILKFLFQKIATPWKEIFTSVPFWALLATHCGNNWAFWTLLTEIPSYMSAILKFDIASVSVCIFIFIAKEKQ